MSLRHESWRKGGRCSKHLLVRIEYRVREFASSLKNQSHRPCNRNHVGSSLKSRIAGASGFNACNLSFSITSVAILLKRCKLWVASATFLAWGVARHVGTAGWISMSAKQAG